MFASVRSSRFGEGLNPSVDFGLKSGIVPPQIGNQDVRLNGRPFGPIFYGFGHVDGGGQAHENPRVGQTSQVRVAHGAVCGAHARLPEDWTSFLVLECTRERHACRRRFPVNDHSDRPLESMGFGMLFREMQRVRFSNGHCGHGVDVSRFGGRFKVLVHPSLAKPFVMTTVDVGGECALFGNKGIGEVRGGIGQVIPKQLHSVGLTAWIASEVDHQGASMPSQLLKSQTKPTLKISP